MCLAGQQITSPKDDEKGTSVGTPAEIDSMMMVIPIGEGRRVVAVDEDPADSLHLDPAAAHFYSRPLLTVNQ